MELFLKAASGILIVLILGQAISQKEIGLLLTVAASVMVGILLVSYLEPVIDFLYQLQNLGDLHGNTLKILLKTLGIAIVTQITQMVCKDAGNASLGQAMMLLGTSVILWLALPIFESVIQMIQHIIGEI